MRRRSFLAALPAVAASGRALAGSRAETPNRNRPDVGSGDRIDGATFASRSAAWGLHGAAATAHPLATLAAIETLKSGGSAVENFSICPSTNISEASRTLRPIGCWERRSSPRAPAR